MTLRTVKGAFRFFGSAPDSDTRYETWSGAVNFTPVQISAAERDFIDNSITSLWVSQTARDSLQAVANAGSIRTAYNGVDVGRGDAFVPANVGNSQNPSYLFFNSSLAVNTIDSYGNVFQLDQKIVLVHEIRHWYEYLQGAGFKDPTDFRDVTLNNNVTVASNVGGTVEFERVVSTEIGISQHRVSYAAAWFPGQDSRPFIGVGGSYTDGQKIDIVRVGDILQPSDPSQTTANVINYANVASNVNILALAFSNADVITGGAGFDYLYGGSGNDTISGGNGNDRLFGETGDDTVFDLRGANFVSGGGRHPTVTQTAIEQDGLDTADYGTLSLAQGVRVHLTSETMIPAYANYAEQPYASYVTDPVSAANIDMLVSVESLTATTKDDVVLVKTLDATRLAGSDGTGGLARIDLGTQSTRDLIDLSALDGAATVILGGGNPRFYKTGQASTSVTVLGAEAVRGSTFDDVLSGSNRADYIAGGAGKDTISGAGGNDYLFTGGSIDNLYYNADTLDGQAGSDNLIAEAGSNAVLRGGTEIDTFWINRDASGTTIVVLDDVVVGEKIYWNGYQLSGGAAHVIDYEKTFFGNPTPYYWTSTLGYLDANGVVYFKTNNSTTLSIRTPDGADIRVVNWQQGVGGITLTGQTFDNFIEHGPLGPDYSEPQYAGLPRSNICDDGQYNNYIQLAGAYASLSNAGPVSEPLFL